MTPLIPALNSALQRSVPLLLGCAKGNRPSPTYPCWAVPSRLHGSSPKNLPLKQWTLVVSPFGRLLVELPCHVRVRPLDPVSYPEGDRVFVTVSGGTRPLPHGPDLKDFEVKYNESAKRMSILSEHIDSQSQVEVCTPARFDLDIKTFGNGSVKIQKVECDNCKIETEKGDSLLQSVKSHHIYVRANGGKIVGRGTLHGNLDIRASGKSTVYLDKLQGTFVNICTEDGLLKTQYLYAESSLLSSAAGDIALGSVHGDVTVESKHGNITIDSSDGSLKACTHQGAIDAYVSQLGKVDLKSQEGNITVKVPASLNTNFQLSGIEIDVSPELQLQGKQNSTEGGQKTLSAHMNDISGREQWIQASTTSGRISLQVQNWFQSLKLDTPTKQIK
ncbi:hypothetical protein NDU88_002186 [Pleurodeles waltl]|uniref:DUF4097 domain-containing protein n=2 Tax=Pleurodeles waltl TaxID=8319 RepID=A0AAV7SE62_PLEWA|nr:hypothetical protein NDU88_002186 [Pleurodeles waltl]